MAPVFSNKFDSFAENNVNTEAYDSFKVSFVNSAIMRPLDFVIDTLVYCADVVSVETYLSEVQSHEPNDFVFAVSFIEHLDLSLNEWSLYYDNDLDEPFGYSSIITIFDLSLLGFFSTSSDYFYFDCLDYDHAPNAILYDLYAGTVLSITDEDIALEDDLYDEELEDEDYHLELDDEHVWFFHTALADTAVIKFSNYLKAVDYNLFNDKLSSFFFHKDGN